MGDVGVKQNSTAGSVFFCFNVVGQRLTHFPDVYVQ
jgi:hypothetical protein